MSSLRALRLAAGLTQEQVAERAGLSQGIVSALELGRHPSPQLDTLERLASVFSCDFATIVAAIKASVAEAEAA